VAGIRTPGKLASGTAVGVTASVGDGVGCACVGVGEAASVVGVASTLAVGDGAVVVVAVGCADVDV